MRIALGLFALPLLLAAVAPPARAADASVESRLAARGIKWEIDEDGDYKVTYSYKKEGRTQLVFVAGHVEELPGMKVRTVFAPAARVSKDGVDGAMALKLLHESNRQKLGDWEIGGDILYFVIKLPDSADAATLEQAMDLVAETADNKELELTGAKDEL